jgi:hypothetical protein
MTIPGRAQPQAPAPAAARHLCVVLHDVAPSRWLGCTRVLRQLRAVAREAGVKLPVTLLVVPMMHGVAGSSSCYLRWLHSQAWAGHELALHGLTHSDEGPPPRSLREYLLRRQYTDSEGEFAALSHAQAAERLAAGRAWAQQHDLAMAGFVAPAWLLNAESWEAVAEAGFDYTCTFDRVVALPERQAVVAPSLVFSNRAGWRRRLSVLRNTLLGRRLRRTPLLRLDLHPGDCENPAVQRCWSRLLAQALREREPLRLQQAAALAREAGTPPARGSA